LDCVLNGLPGDHGCPTHPDDPFGFVTLDDLLTPGEVHLTVDLGTGLKFKSLLLNIDPLLTVTGFTGGSLSPNSFNVPPYAGLFDITVGGGDNLFTTMFAADQYLTVYDFLAKDSLDYLFLAIHIQSIGPGECDGFDDGATNCLPGVTGDGSLKIGASSYFLPPEEIPPEELVPEPSTFILLGGGLACLIALRGRSRRRTHP